MHLQRVLIIILWISHFYVSLPGQSLLLDGNNYNTCAGNFQDPGTPNYGPNLDLTTTLCPDGANGLAIRINFAPLELGSGDTLFVFDGDDVNAPLVAQFSAPLDLGGGLIQASLGNLSGCLTFRFVSDAMQEGAGWNGVIDCQQLCQEIVPSISNTLPPTNPPDTGWIDLCPGQSVTLIADATYPENNSFYPQSNTTSLFVWDFGDGRRDTGQTVTHQYAAPGGYYATLEIIDQRGCTSPLLTRRVRLAAPPDFAGRAVPLDTFCLGDSILLQAAINRPGGAADILTVNSRELSFAYPATRIDTVPLPDGNGITFRSTITLNGFETGQLLADPNQLLGVFANLEHSFLYDLQIRLRCPSGQAITLHQFDPLNPGNDIALGQPVRNDFGTPVPGDGFTYRWEDNQALSALYDYAVNNPAEVVAPAGNYAPFQSFTDLIGCPLNGSWTLEITDSLALDNGFLFSWGLDFDPLLLATTETFDPGINQSTWRSAPNVIDQNGDLATGLIDASGNVIYGFRVTDNFGCLFDTLITVPSRPDNHPACLECAEENLLAADTIMTCPGDSMELPVQRPQLSIDTITFADYPNYAFGNANHPPANPHRAPLLVEGVYPGVLTDADQQMLSVCLNIKTDFAGDVDIFLEAPSGERLELSTGNGGANDDYLNTCFTPIATNSITTGLPPFVGDWLPEGSFTDLNGATVNGLWNLIVSDAFDPDVLDTLQNWAITFQRRNAIESIAWSPATEISCTDCDTATVFPNSDRTYRVTVNDRRGCTYADSVHIDVEDPLPAPIVQCQQTGLDRLLFTWENPLDTGDYQIRLTVNDSTGDWSLPRADTFFTVNGLNELDTVRLEVRLFSPSGCPNNIGSATCLIINCQLALAAGSLRPPSCAGAADGQIEVVAENGTPTYQYFFDGSTLPTPTPRFSNLTAGTYTIIVRDTLFCTDTLIVNLTDPDSLQVDLQVRDSITCFNGADARLEALTVGGTGPYRFDWNTGASNTDGLLGNLPPGAYRVTVTDANNCQTIDSTDVFRPDSLIFTFGTTTPTCANSADGSLTVQIANGAPPYTYVWDTGDNTNNIDQLPAGSYCVTVSDANNCTVAGCIDLVAPPPLQIDSVALSPVVCFGSSTGSATVFASGGSGAYSYQWDDPLGQIGQTASFLAAGDYRVIVRDASACPADTIITLAEADSLRIEVEATSVSCKGESDGRAQVSVNGGAAPYRYRWDTGDTTQTVAGLPVGSYEVRVTDARNCTQVITVDIGEPQNPLSVGIEQTRQACFGASTNELRALPQGGNDSIYTFLWSDGQTTATAIGLDTVAYQVTVTDASGCTTVSGFTPVDLLEINPNIILSLPSCNGIPDGRLGINLITGRPGFTLDDFSFKWSTGATSQAISGLEGNQNYSVTVTDPLGCSASESRFLRQPSPITFQVDIQMPTCNGATNGSARVDSIMGDNDNFTIRWDASAGNQVGPEARNLGAGRYGVTVTDEDFCASERSILIEEPTPIQVAFETTDVSCFGQREGSATAFPTGGTPPYIYEWSDGSRTAATDSLPAGSNTIRITDAQGCTQMATVVIEQPDPFMVERTIKSPTCFGDRDGTLQLEVSGGVEPYAYSIGSETFSGSPFFAGLPAGRYDLIIEDAVGCVYFERLELEGPDELMAIASADATTINLGDSVQLLGAAANPQGTAAFEWVPPYEGTLSCRKCPDPVAAPEDRITYRLTVTDSAGCEANDLITIQVDKPRVVEVPTGFSPNDDGRNDRLLVHGQQNTRVLRFEVYDRWGERVFVDGDFLVNDPNRGWDGTFNKENAPLGTYIWYLEVEYTDGQTQFLNGTTTLIR